MSCPLCEEFRQKYPLTHDDGELVHIIERHEDGRPLQTSGPIRCAFESSEKFSSDNWCCKTMSLIRSIFSSGRIHSTWHNDSNIGVIPIPIADEIQQGMLVMSWYKNRGRTGQAIIIDDYDEPKKLNLKTAQFIIKEVLKHI